MARIMEVLLIWLGCALTVSCLVHRIRFETYAEGCVTPMGNVPVGHEVNDNQTCGIFVCNDLEGNGFYIYCQITASFANCKNELIDTNSKFPDCCWQCVEGVECPQKPGQKSSTEGGPSENEGHQNKEAPLIKVEGQQQKQTTPS